MDIIFDIWFAIVGFFQGIMDYFHFHPDFKFVGGVIMIVLPTVIALIVLIWFWRNVLKPFFEFIAPYLLIGGILLFIGFVFVVSCAPEAEEVQAVGIEQWNDDGSCLVLMSDGISYKNPPSLCKEFIKKFPIPKDT